MSALKTVVVTCNSCGGDAYEEAARSVDFEYSTCEEEFLFVRCTQCGLIYLRNRPDVSELGTIYPKDYIPYHFNEHLGSFIATARNYVQRGKVKPIARYAREGATVVDIGCGSAELLRIAQQFGDPSWRLVGVDFADEAVANLERLGIESRQARFEDLEWDEPPPQIVIMNQVIEHLEDPRGAVGKAYDLVSPGGVLLVETPSLDGWDARMFKRRYWGGWHTPRHWNLYDEKTLGSLLRGQGFEVVETSYLLSPNFWLQSVHHYLLERWSSPRLARLFDVSVLPSLVGATALDVFQKLVRRKTSNFRMVGRKRA